VKQSAFSTFLFFYYNQVLGLSGALAGMAALMALLVDAITDPMVGRLSDRFKSRWGRRHPFMLAGAIPFGIAIMVLFAPPDGLSQMQLFSWMLGGAFAFSPQMVYFTGLLESMSDTAKLILIFSVNGISQIFFIAYIILVDSMLSDVIDEHELNTGKREEGLFFAARSFATKASYGLGSFFAGTGLESSTFRRARRQIPCLLRLSSVWPSCRVRLCSYCLLLPCSFLVAIASPRRNMPKLWPQLKPERGSRTDC
jgi:Na+/melibiose symporter-like transporter